MYNPSGTDCSHGGRILLLKRDRWQTTKLMIESLMKIKCRRIGRILGGAVILTVLKMQEMKELASSSKNTK